MVVLLLVVLAAVVGATAWWRRRRPRARLEANDSYERAKGQAYLQAQHTRNNIGDPFH